jgi:shikimate kinase
MSNVILIGMPGSGKSTVGVVLAKVLGCEFVDGDLVIQQKTGKLLHEIISEIGADGFNELENEVNMTISPESAVISPGGSVVYGEGAMLHYKSIGKVVFLNLPVEELKTRLGDLNERGVSLKDGQTLDDLYAERLPLYTKYADYTVECGGRSLRSVVKEIEAYLSDN